jgi:hypothetical protein
MAFFNTVPDGSTINFQPGGCYLIDYIIRVTDRNNLVINGNGATFRDTASDPGITTWGTEGGSNITYENMTIYGSDPSHQYVASLEWQYGIDFEATQGGTVNNVNIYNVYGDFVEAEYDHQAGAIASQPARNILVENSNFSGAGRMGVGLTDVIGFTMENTSISDVTWDAVDVETDVNQEYASNIQILNNTFSTITLSLLSNYGYGYYPNVGNITFSGNIETNAPSTCAGPVGVNKFPGEYRSNYTITNNQLYSGSGGIGIDGVENATIANNTVNFVLLGCNLLAGIVVIDSHTVSVENNSIVGPFTAAVSVDDLSTGVTLSGNSQ